MVISPKSRFSKNGFTLIELLIVIAIILILIAIALPNFLEAQIRARVTKAKAELRSLQTCFESYQTDYRQYPRGILEAPGTQWLGPTANWGFVSRSITTPVAYMSNTILTDLFAINYVQAPDSGDGHPFTRYRTTRRMWWNYGNNETCASWPQCWIQPYTPATGPVCTEWKNLYDVSSPQIYGAKQYLISSMGPDHSEDACPPYNFALAGYSPGSEFYAPTNGTVSKGDLVVLGP